jgi:predicted small secreted protein
MLRKVLTMVLIGSGIAITACNTVRGAGEDVKSVANCTENAIDGTGRC